MDTMNDQPLREGYSKEELLGYIRAFLEARSHSLEEIRKLIVELEEAYLSAVGVDALKEIFFPEEEVE